MKTALAIMNFPLEGTHHRAIDDARNIASLASVMLPHIEEQINKLNP
jgi:inhibitor of KinA sporulation pathway (predicted exonuclease)